jgi:hypothetical protein
MRHTFLGTQVTLLLQVRSYTLQQGPPPLMQLVTAIRKQERSWVSCVLCHHSSHTLAEERRDGLNVQRKTES